MSKNLTVAMLFGGQSAEHEVSVQSAINVNQALLSAGYNVIPIAIDKQGVWRLAPKISVPESTWPRAAILPGGNGEVVVLDAERNTVNVDVVFPVLHGPNGEDGTVQGLLKLANVAFVGPGLLASAVCMDKEFTKNILISAGIPTVKSISFTQDAIQTYTSAQQQLGSILFVKPANMGSSVGVSKAHDEGQYQKALTYAFQYDTKVIVESFADGQEIECAVLSTNKLEASVPGEIVPRSNDGFYSYDAKYVDADGAELIYPAHLPADMTEKIQGLSLAACQALNCEGMVRVDFFLKANGELFVNELNTIPGFTAISMYPKLWEASGIPPKELVVHLINHALSRFQREGNLASNVK